MKKIRKVKIIEVKRAYVISNRIVSHEIRKHKNTKDFLSSVSLAKFQRKLEVTKKESLKFSEPKLNKIISDEYEKRTRAYDNATWYIGEVKLNEIGVWRRAGRLPLKWTNQSLKETGERVKEALANNSKLLRNRPKHAIKNILNTNINFLQKEKYLFPIIFQHGTGTNGRRRLKYQVKGDIDEGCIRSIALAISGVKKIKVYIGFPKKS